MEQIIVSTEKEKLDVAFIHQFITESYWGNGRTIDEMKICIENSLNFGLYIGAKQIGYARVVTDYFQFAYLMDVFIDNSFRGKGYSKVLLQNILEHELLSKIKVWRLATADAHGLYKQFGFAPLSKSQNMMERIQ